MVIEYFAISSAGTEMLSYTVSQLILDGWRPQGGISVAIHTDKGKRHAIFAQAMVREREEFLTVPGKEYASFAPARVNSEEIAPLVDRAIEKLEKAAREIEEAIKCESDG